MTVTYELLLRAFLLLIKIIITITVIIIINMLYSQKKQDMSGTRYNVTADAVVLKYFKLFVAIYCIVHVGS